MKYPYFRFFWSTTILLVSSNLYSHPIDELLIRSPLQQHLIDIEITEPNTGLDLVDCIYVINLDKRIHLWKHLRDALEKNGLFANRVNAINGWELSDRIIQIITPSKRKMKGGAVGCFLSHISVLKNAHENGFNIIWILEDDAEIINNLKKIPNLIRTLSNLDPKWDILYTDVRNFGINGRGCEGSLPMKVSDFLDKNLMKAGNRYGTYSLLISKSGIEKLLNYFICNLLRAPIDIEIHWIPNLRKYSIRYNLVSYIKNTTSNTEFPP